MSNSLDNSALFSFSVSTIFKLILLFLLILENTFHRQIYGDSLAHASRGKLLWQSKQNIQIGRRRKGFWLFFSSHGSKIIVLQWSFLQYDHKKVSELSKWYLDGWSSNTCYSITTEDINCIQTSHWKAMTVFFPFLLPYVHMFFQSVALCIYIYIHSLKIV